MPQSLTQDFTPLWSGVAGWPALGFRSGGFGAQAPTHTKYMMIIMPVTCFLKTALSLFSVYPDFLIYYLYCCLAWVSFSYFRNFEGQYIKLIQVM